MPSFLRLTAVSDDDVVMAIEHKELPICAVQFHPESILTMEDDHGLRMIRNVVKAMTTKKSEPVQR